MITSFAVGPKVSLVIFDLWGSTVIMFFSAYMQLAYCFYLFSQSPYIPSLQILYKTLHLPLHLFYQVTCVDPHIFPAGDHKMDVAWSKVSPEKCKK